MNKSILVYCSMVTIALLSSCNKSENTRFNHDYLPVKLSKGDNWSIINKSGNVVVKEEYPADASISRIYDGTYWVRQNNKYQLFSLDSPKKPLIDEDFTAVTKFSAGVSAVSNPNEPIRVIGTDGKTIATLPTSIKRCFAFSENGYAVVCDTNDKYGMIDKKGHITIQPNYAYLAGESEGLVLAVKEFGNGKYSILDTKNGNQQGEIEDSKYDLQSLVFKDGKITSVYQEDKESPIVVLDKSGRRLFDIKRSAANQYLKGESYVDGYIVFANSEGKFGIADSKGEMTIRPKYDFIFNLGKGMFSVNKNGKFGIVNAEDETVVDFDYKDTYCLMGDNFVMINSNCYSLIDKNGKEITSFEQAGMESCSTYAEYVDITNLARKSADVITAFAMPLTAELLANQYHLNVDNYHYSSDCNLSNNSDKVSHEFRIYFNGRMTEEMTHQEQVDDGWFTTTHTVSDGWTWTDATISHIRGTLTINDPNLSEERFEQSLKKALKDDAYEETDNETLTKAIENNDKTYESRISLSNSGYNRIYIRIEHIEK